MATPFERITLIVLDSVGIGGMPDAADYGDAGRDTLGHICELCGLNVPNLVRLGLANIRPLAGLTPPASPAGAYGKAAFLSPGKDTTTGHWEIAGIILDCAFPTYPQGFPRELIEKLEAAIGRRTLGNFPASGTAIINQLGEEHLRRGWPIVYTSADSVFQIAAHEEVIPVGELYRMCRTARAMLQGEHRVGRVIARLFRGQPDAFVRTERRHDYAVEPPYPMLLDLLKEAGIAVVGVGKIPEIFLHRGITETRSGKNNREMLESVAAAMGESRRSLVFAKPRGFRHALRPSS
jgi:phosphopentomutase